MRTDIPNDDLYSETNGTPKLTVSGEGRSEIYASNLHTVE